MYIAALFEYLALVAVIFTLPSLKIVTVNVSELGFTKGCTFFDQES